MAWHFLNTQKNTTFLPAKTCRSQVSTEQLQHGSLPWLNHPLSEWDIHPTPVFPSSILTAGHCSLSTCLGQGKQRSREPWLPHWPLRAQDLQVPTCLHPLTKCKPPGWEHMLCWIKGSGRQECNHSIPDTVISAQTPTQSTTSLLLTCVKDTRRNNSRRSLCTNTCK